jgi:hypothetical protein
MTPLEIKVAIRMLGKKVVYDAYNQVIYTGDKYVVRYPGCDRPLFGKDGDFDRSWVGYKMFSPHKFEVVEEIPQRRRRPPVIRK